jgi:hypothetical protein
MTKRFFRYETILYAAAFLLALALRMASLARMPLSDSEATLALQALALSRGQQSLVAPYPAYLGLTSAWMFLMGDGQWIARFWPAVASSFLVLCPAFFKKQLGGTAALLLSFFLALDPAMLAVSRQVDGPAIALFCVALFGGLFIRREAAYAGIAAGLALLSGPRLWPGLLGIGLAYLASRRLGLSREKETGREAPVPGFEWMKFTWFLLGTVFFAGTLFFFFPRGLSAMAAGLPAFLNGWAVGSGVPASLLAAAVVGYEFLLLFLGGWGSVRGLAGKDPLDIFLLIWWLVSLVIALIYPARQVSDLAWSILPLAALATRQSARVFHVPPADLLPTLGQAALSGLIFGFISLTLLAMVNNPQFLHAREYWIRLLGAAVLLIASVALIAWGWSKDVSFRGLSWGGVALLGIYSISSAWNVAGLSSRSGLELWDIQQALPDEKLLVETIDQVNQHHTAVSGGNDIVVAGLASPALQWALRGYPKVDFVLQYPVGSAPAFIITRDQPDLTFAVPYRGQDFVLAQDVSWELLNAQDWLRWVAFRAVPEEALLNEKMILWARTDLFPDGSATAGMIK